MIRSILVCALYRRALLSYLADKTTSRIVGFRPQFRDFTIRDAEHVARMAESFILFGEFYDYLNKR